MAEVIASGVFLLLILATWKLMVLRSIIGAAEDRLDALRYDVSRFAQDHPCPANDHALRELERLLAAYKSGIKMSSLLDFATFSRSRWQNPEIFAQMDRRLRERLHTDDVVAANFIASIRKSAASVCFQFMAKQYFWCWIAIVFILPCLLISKGVSVLRSMMLAFASRVYSYATGSRSGPGKEAAMRHTLEELTLESVDEDYSAQHI